MKSIILIFTLITYLGLTFETDAYSLINTEQPNCSYCTGSQGGYHANCHSVSLPSCQTMLSSWLRYSPACIRDVCVNNIVFVLGNTSNRGFTVTFTNVTTIKNFLPGIGQASVFTFSDTDPNTTSAGVFAGQLLTAMINVYVSQNFTDLSSLTFSNYTGIPISIHGLTLHYVIYCANQVISSQPSVECAIYKATDLNDALNLFNINYETCTSNNNACFYCNTTMVLTNFPVGSPTHAPALASTDVPTLYPTITPIYVPVIIISQAPTDTSTVSPTNFPTIMPTTLPIVSPTTRARFGVIVDPIVTPIVVPTIVPTIELTIAPIVASTVVPTNFPTIAPTTTATISPTIIPTITPTVTPTIAPTIELIVAPIVASTVIPTNFPTTVPTTTPIVSPPIRSRFGVIVDPIITPTVMPTIAPTEPTIAPIVAPIVVPTNFPTIMPTTTPIVSLTITPTIASTVVPTVSPTVAPTIASTIIRTTAPIDFPTTRARFGAIVDPIVIPTVYPTIISTIVPTTPIIQTTTPTCQPTQLVVTNQLIDLHSILVICCGNGIVEGNEECDEGTTNNNIYGTCLENCKRPRCGDGIIHKCNITCLDCNSCNEKCDDGNNQNGDGCSNDCHFESFIETQLNSVIVSLSGNNIFSLLGTRDLTSKVKCKSLICLPPTQEQLNQLIAIEMNIIYWIHNYCVCQ